jgi:hypothetical protein
MTTVAADARAGVMVADSRATIEGACWLPATKMYRFDGEIVGLCGDSIDEAKWLAWRRAGKRGKFPKLTDEFQGLVLKAAGLWWLDDKGGEMLIERGFHAIGSGGNCAITALILGHDAKTAVEVACQVDPHSGGEIVSMRLEE